MYQVIPHLYVIAGLAGSGKTRLIKKLQTLRAQAINLEGLAGHRGSVFGFRHALQNPSQKIFHQRLKSIWESLDLSQPVFIEREGPFIGRHAIPKLVYDQMQPAPTILLNTNRYRRIEFILSDYSHLSTKEINGALDKLAPNLGHERLAQCKMLLKKNDLPQLVDCLLSYYDQSKHYQIEKEAHLTISVCRQGMEAIARDLLLRIGQ